MADQLNMNGLSLNGSQHANGGPGFSQGRQSYIPPHMRGSSKPGPGPAPGPGGLDGTPMSGGPGMNGSAWGPNKYVAF